MFFLPQAYSMPMYPPYIYLFPLQQTHTMNPRGPSRSPSPSPCPSPALQYSSTNHHVQQQEPYDQPTLPPPSAHFDQAPVAHQHSEAFQSTRYQVMEQQQQQQLPSLSWQQQQQIPPANTSSFPVSYPSSTPHYPVPQQIPQGYHPSQGPALPVYPAAVPPYPYTTLAYQPSPARVHEEPQANLEVVEKNQHSCGPADAVQGSVAAGLVNSNSRAVVLPPFGMYISLPASCSQ